MKNLILPLLLSFSFSSGAQFAAFPTPGLEYGAIYVCNPFDCPDYLNSSMRYAGDTVLCGKIWNRFLFLPNLSVPLYVRAEQGKYYYLIDCNNELLMYDFSKTAGDTVATYDLGKLVVAETGTFTLDNGAVRKKMILHHPGSPLFPLYTWVDGVGDIERSFLRQADFEGGHEQLVCLRDASGVFYHSQSWALDCDSLLCPLPRPDFDFTCAGQTFQFKNLSRESDEYFWDFGDGGTSTETDPVHVFSEPGCYTVTLKAKSDCLPQQYPVSKRVTVDAPVFWRKTAVQPPEYFYGIQYLDNERAWAIGEKTIWKTIDGGASWDSVAYPGPLRRLIDLHFHDAEHGIVQLLMPGSPYYSEILWTDDGETWTLHTPDDSPSISAIERVNDSVAVVAAHYQGIFLTKNGGQSWSNVYSLGGISLITDFESPGGDTVYFAGINQLWPPFSQFGFGKSYDALNWQVQEFPGITGSRSISFIDAQKGWFSNGNSVYITENGGQSWAWQANTPVHVYDIRFVDALHGWACGHQTGMYGTGDGGQTWVQQACVRASENLNSLTAVSPAQAYVMSKDGLLEFISVPDTVSLCAVSSAGQPWMKRRPLFSVQPNPANDVIRVIRAEELPDNAVLAFFDALGREIMLRETSAGSVFSVAHLPPGLYFIRCSVDGAPYGAGVKLLIRR